MRPFQAHRPERRARRIYSFLGLRVFEEQKLTNSVEFRVQFRLRESFKRNRTFWETARVKLYLEYLDCYRLIDLDQVDLEFIATDSDLYRRRNPLD